MQDLYSESKEFFTDCSDLPEMFSQTIPNPQEKLCDYILTNIQPNNPKAAIEGIDKFCYKNWMMNLGDLKSRIVIKYLQKYKPMKIIEIGGYCGYSALVLAANSSAQVHTIEISQKWAQIANKIHKHAGLSDRIHINIGTISTSKDYIKKIGPFDYIFIDHVKNLYLSDFKLLQSYDIIHKGTIIVGDNIICPGAPDYLEHFKISKQYRSKLYHCHVQYSSKRDGVLVSQRIC